MACSGCSIIVYFSLPVQGLNHRHLNRQHHSKLPWSYAQNVMVIFLWKTQSVQGVLEGIVSFASMLAELFAIGSKRETGARSGPKCH